MTKKLKVIINDIPVEVDAGDTVLQAAEHVGIEIPTMCHLKGRPSQTSCMVCMVKDLQADKLIPSCSIPVTDGMKIDTHSKDVIRARKTALELLLSEHIGECEAPCHKTCPADIDIPKVFTAIQQGKLEQAYSLLRLHFVKGELPCVKCLGKCEKICRRKKMDTALGIRQLMTAVVDRVQVSSEKISHEPHFKKKQYQHSLGKLKDADYEQMLAGCRILSEQSGVEKSKLIDEASRCLMCGCSKSESCKLRIYATEYAAKLKAYSSSSQRDIKIDHGHPNVVFEVGKCIKCGKCVRLTAEDPTAEGMAYVGRGFDVKIKPVSGVANELTLGEDSSNCVENCPTAALAWRDRIR